MNIQWKAQDYSSRFQFVHQYGEDVLALMEIQPGETIIDLGCGNGALTKKIADLGAQVLGIDASEEMLAQAGKTYPDLDFRLADAAAFTVSEPVDGIFSNAVFHWIENQDQLSRNLAKALKPGGRLVCEFGGKGNTAAIHGALEQAFKERDLSYSPCFYFPSVGEYTSLLEAHGFQVVFACLFDRLTPLKGSQGMQDWIHMFLTRPFEGLEESLKREIIEDAMKSLQPELFRDDVWYADYIRIRVKAIRL